MEVVRTSETSVNFYETTQRIPENGHFAFSIVVGKWLLLFSGCFTLGKGDPDFD
jgi:hypothetical protein